MAACAAGLCLFVILWMGLGWDVILSPVSYEGKKGDYYSSLVHGFLSGHVYMDKVADPGLASADPEVRKKTPTLLDASYYKGHFYLYFGVTPAALILFPYAMLTGGDLDPRVAVALCVVLGFLLSLIHISVQPAKAAAVRVNLIFMIGCVRWSGRLQLGLRSPGRPEKLFDLL